MRRAAWWSAGVAVALAVLFVLALPPPSPPSHPSVPARASPLPGVPALEARVGDLARVLGWSAAETQGAIAWISGLTPAQLALLKESASSVTHGAAPSSAVRAAFGAHMLASFNYYCLGASVAAGAAIGGAVGAVPGLIIGGIAGAVAGYFGCQQATNGGATSRAAVAWIQALMSAFGNEYNLTSAWFNSLVSTLNITEDAWQRAADNAALTQLGNSTFSVDLDLDQSEILSNLAPVIDVYANETAQIAVALLAAFDGGAATGAVYGTQGLTITGSGGASPYQGSPIINYLGPEIATGADAYLTSGELVYCTAASTTISFAPVVSTGTASYDYSCPASGTLVFRFEGPTQVYTVTIGSGNIYVPGGANIPTAGTGPSSTAGFGYWSLWNGAASLSAQLGSPVAGDKASSPVTASYSIDPGFSGSGYGDVGGGVGITVGGLEWTAAQNGEAYWAFLRAAGFTSASQVPPDCIIPEPYMVLPSSLDEASLNVSEWESLYLATLQGMAHFYNTSLGGSSFCGTQAVRQWKVGGAPWGNLAINATGMIYLNNGTSAIDVNGAALSTEEFTIPTTWAIGNDSYPCPGNYSANCKGAQQLLLMPTISTVHIPVGVRWAVPKNDPVEVFAVQSGQDLWLTGNGTGSGACSNVTGSFCAQARPVAALTPGDSLYLTSCVIGGAATDTCSVTVQTVNITVANITCTGPCQQPAPGGGGLFGIPNPFAAFANWLASLFGGGPLGQLLGSLLAAVVVAALVLVGIYALYRVVTYRRSGSGGGGVTFVSSGR